ncbi:prolipoprotein diacylglyceryl transferase [Fundicoccus sp. Sow4_D5]|uniref:prolipoprotein diacylglyceryl transferase n=1 Tax=unclassified Fundicoccus TaxID=2761543 RepID=UPI003F8E3018
MKTLINLGLFAAIDRIAFDIGGWPVHWYGLIMGLCILIAYVIFSREGKRKGIDEDTLFNLLFWMVVIGYIGARLYYVAFRLEHYLANPAQIIMIWQGGIAIYGGIIAGAVTIYVMSKRSQLNPASVFDITAPAIMLAQALGRWGNFINQEAYGGEVSRSFLESLYLPNVIIEQMNVNGVYHHPTFLYESVWNLLGLILILVLRRKPKFFRQGEIAATYVIWYGIGRAFIEGMRTDSLYLGPLRVSQWLSMILVVAGLVFVIYRRKQSFPEIPYYEEDEISRKA